MIRLRAENERLRAENAVIKKEEIALREERWAAQLKGEKAALVKELREEGYALKYLLAAMKLSKSTYYYEIGKVDKVQERNADISS